MPGEEGLRRDEERRPPLFRYETGEKGDDRPIRPGEAGAGNLPAQHGQLVTEDKDLRVLGGRVHPVDAKRFQYAPNET